MPSNNVTATLLIFKQGQTYTYQLQVPGLWSPAALLMTTQSLTQRDRKLLGVWIKQAAQLFNDLLNHRETGRTRLVDKDRDFLQGLGQLLYNRFFPEPLQRALHMLPAGATITLISNEQELPWELAHDGETYLALKYCMARQLPLGQPTPQPRAVRQSARSSALLIGNPTGDLPNSSQEIETLARWIEAHTGARPPHILLRTRAAKEAVLREMASGAYDLIHYSGHATFVPGAPEQSGLILAHEQILTAAEIRQHLTGRPIIFLNGCGTAQTAAPTQQGAEPAYLGQVVQGMAAAFVEAGAQAFIGSLWPISTAGPADFALHFYRAVLQGASLTYALHQTRIATQQANPVDPLWASYVLYGDPDQRLFKIPTVRTLPATVLAVRLADIDALYTMHQEDEANELAGHSLATLAEQATRHDGVIYSLTNDTLICTFGIPQTQENDAVRAVTAAIAMRATGAEQQAVRIGMSSGKLRYAPATGAGQAALLTGSALAEAVRLAAQADVGEIRVTGAVRPLVRQLVELRLVTNKEELAQPPVYRVVARWADGDPLGRRAFHRTALVGRQYELARLTDLWQRVIGGRGQIVDLIGEAGVGKSRLLYALYEQVGATAQWIVLTHPATYQTSSVWLLRQLLYGLLALSPATSPNELQQQLRERVQSLANHTDTKSDSVDEYSLLVELLDLPLPAAALVSSDPEIRHRQRVQLLRKWVTQTAIDRPLILAVEDMHLADESSREVLAQLAAGLNRSPVLLITLVRPEAAWQPPWQGWRNYETIRLQRLNTTEAHALLAQLLAQDEILPAIVTTILEPAGGNPFFIHEWLFSLREAQLLRQEAGQWRLQQPTGAFIPDTVDRVIRLRVETLAESAQRILPIVTVLGERIEEAVLQQALANLGLELLFDDAIDHLLEHAFLEWDGRENAYYFTHALLQSVIYSSLRSEERRRYHRLVGQTLRAVYAGRESLVLEVLAHHFYQSLVRPGAVVGTDVMMPEAQEADLLQAITYLMQAGSQAVQQYAPRQAVLHYERASQVGMRLGDLHSHLRAEAQECLGEAHELLGNFTAAITAYEAAFTALQENALQPTDRRQTADLARRIGRLQGWLNQFDEAHSHMAQARQLLTNPVDETDRATAALIHTHTGSLYYLQGEFAQAEAACQQALTLLAGQEEGAVAATTFNVLGVICDVTGRWTQAIAFFEQSRTIWARLDDRHRLAEVTDNLGTLSFNRGDFAQAATYYRENLAFWQSMEAVDSAAYAALNLGSIEQVFGNLTQAEAYFTQALTAFQQVQNDKLTGLACNNLGMLELTRDDFQRAQAYFQQSLAVETTAEYLRGLSEAELGLGNAAGALAHAQQSLTLAQENQMPFEEGVTRRALGRIYLAYGDQQRAQQELRQSLTILEVLGAQYETARTLTVLALLEGNSVTDPTLRQSLVRAIAIFEEVGARSDLAYARKCLDAC